MILNNKFLQNIFNFVYPRLRIPTENIKKQHGTDDLAKSILVYFQHLTFNTNHGPNSQTLSLT